MSVSPIRALDPTSLPEMLENLFGFPPHKDQIEAIKALAINKKDLILIARTGWGKSMIFQSIPVLQGGICIMLMPLNLLEDEQALSIEKLPFCRPCVLNSRSKSLKLQKEIRSGQYTHVLLGPEIALSDFFLEILQDQKFQQRLALIAIDELHVVDEWGKRWRESYSQLALLRSRINPDIPWFGTSATLDPTMLESVKELAGFAKDTRVLATTIDRPDISLCIRPIQHTLNSFRDLEFLITPAAEAVEEVVGERATAQAQDAYAQGDLITAKAIIASEAERKVEREPGKAGPESNACCSRIPKTIVYMETIVQLEAAEGQLIKWLINAGCSKVAAENAVRVYHSELAEFDKRAISTEFSKPDVEDILSCSCHRIILATDAMGMGIDNPDIKRVINWQQPASICALIQRAGRAARSRGSRGKFIWLVERWCLEPRLDPTATPTQSKNKMDANASRRSSLPRGMCALINNDSCIRRGILEFFGEDLSQFRQPEGYCCSRCSGEPLDPPKSAYTVNHTLSPAWVTRAVKQALLAWRERKAKETLPSTKYGDQSVLLVDPVVSLISRAAKSIDTISSLKALTEEKWAFYDEFGEEVFEIVQAACKRANPRG